MADGTPDITSILQDASNGRTDALERLLPIVYEELRRLAANQLRNERPDHSLNPTALVHEAYLRLVIPEALDLKGRSHFFSVAARIMRNVLVDHARRRTSQKRGRQFQVTLEPELVGAGSAANTDVLEIDAALETLARLDPRQAQLVELRYFAGLSIEETAGALGVSTATVKRDWVLARAWLERELGEK